MNSNAEKPLIGMALFAFIDAVIDYFANRYALPLFIYIGRSLYHKYIYLSQKKCAVVNCERSYEDDAELERASYDPTIPKFSSDIEMMDFLRRELTNKEWFCVQLIVLQGHTATEVSEKLGITKQAVNQCKNRALKKLRNCL